MNYVKARTKIKTGDLLFWSHGSFKSWHDIEVLIVRAATLSEYSHVGFAWVVNGRVFVIHAISRGVCIEPLSNQGSFYWLPMDVEFSDDVLDKAFRFLGRLKPGADKSWMCAELMSWFYEQAGYVLSREITPAGIAKAALSNGKTIQYITQGLSK